jgi:glycosyltransferase involved in cell wall biosynthesis
VKPRVLFVGRTRYRLPLSPGLARKFAAFDAELDWHVLASGAGGGDARFTLLPDARPRVLDGLLFYLLLPLRVGRELRRLEPRAVVAESPQIAAAVLLARPRAKLIVEVHGNWRLATRLHGARARAILAPVSNAVSSWALRRADAVRALSPYTAGLVEQARGRPPETTFATYSDLSAFAGPPVPLPERPTALFVGVLERYKNVDGLVAAWRRVARELPDARLVVVGRGTLEPLVRELGVEYFPELPPDGVARRMDESTVLVLPSRFEGLGRVVIESFARGRGVVGAASGGIRDLVRDGVEGLLVDHDDTDALAEALVRVLSDSALAERLGAAAAERYRELHTTPEEFAARVRALVDTALD